MAVERHFRVVQLDECVITKKTMGKYAWTLPKTNIVLDQSEVYTKTYAVIVAISRECGVDLVQVYDKSINKQKFKTFLENLRAKYMFDDILLMMDNLSLHKAGDTKRLMDELGFMYTFTPVYSPQYNGVEEVINIGKKVIKDKRLEMLVQKKAINLKQVILDAFTGIEPHQAAKCIARSL